jgi:hypothetical protein
MISMISIAMRDLHYIQYCILCIVHGLYRYDAGERGL